MVGVVEPRSRFASDSIAVYYVIYKNGLRIPKLCLYLLKSYFIFLLIFFFFFLQADVPVVTWLRCRCRRRRSLSSHRSTENNGHTIHTHTHTHLYTQTRRILTPYEGGPFRMHRNARRSFRPRAPPKRTWSKLANTIESPFCI